jgi:hypothetical protein
MAHQSLYRGEHLKMPLLQPDKEVLELHPTFAISMEILSSVLEISGLNGNGYLKILVI